LAYESNGFLANQSKPFPCAVNTINVGLRLNVPLLRTCQHPQDASAFNFTPSVSITGLFGSTTSHGSLPISGDATFVQSGAWSNNQRQGLLKVTPQSETVAGQLYYFRFNLDNRAEGQNAPAVSIEVDTLECCSAATCNAANTGCSKRASTPFFNTTTGVETPWQTAHHTSGSFMDREEVRPLFIRSAGFYSHSSVRQSTSNPCADNTITVTMRVTVPLYERCGTNLTLTGLLGMATTNKSRPMLSLGSTTPADKFEAYTWEQNTGRLVVGVTQGDIDATSDGDYVLSFTFDVENPAEGQPAQTIWLQGSFSDSLTYDGDGRWHDSAGGGGLSGTSPVHDGDPQPLLLGYVARRGHPRAVGPDVLPGLRPAPEGGVRHGRPELPVAVRHQHDHRHYAEQRAADQALPARHHGDQPPERGRRRRGRHCGW